MKKLIFILALAISSTQCKKEDHFTLAKGQVGQITSLTTVQELPEIFAKDSLVSHLGEGDFADASYDEYLVYTKKGDHLLTLVPKQQHDSTSTFENIQILSPKYKTIKGLSLKSTFRDIIDHYTVNKVESTFTTAVLFVDEIDATITIDKKELGINDFGTEKITIEQIPDLAKIKTLTFWFD